MCHAAAGAIPSRTAEKGDYYYRYFDTFGVELAYEFGYGLSYTSFDIDVLDVTVTAAVTNTGGLWKNRRADAGGEPDPYDILPDHRDELL